MSFKNAVKCLEILDEHLDGSQRLVGGNRSIAAVTAFCAIDFAAFVKLTIKDEQKNLPRWTAEVNGLPRPKARVLKASTRSPGRSFEAALSKPT